MDRPRALAVVAALLLLPFPASAQTTDPQQSSTPPPLRGSPPDFLLGRPHGLVAIRGGWLFTNTASDLYDFISDQLTVDGSNFNTASIAGDLGFSFGSRFDVIATLEQAVLGRLLRAAPPAVAAAWRCRVRPGN